MSRISFNAILFRAIDLARRSRRDTRGVAAIEFAFIAPIMVFMFIGAVELSQAIIVDRRITQASSSIADLVARQENKMLISEMTDIVRIGGFIMAPYDQAPLQVVVRNVSSSPSDEKKTKQSWQCTAAGANATPVCTCMNETYLLPSGLVTTNDSVVVAEVTYTYTPRVFDYFLKSGSPGKGGPGTYTLNERVFMKPRGQAAILQQKNGADCPSPTY
jgi:Flp pilus assembly protein TadG